MRSITRWLAAATLTIAVQPATAAGHLEEITVAYFVEWPLPMMAARDAGAYEDVLGLKINWVSFETGTAMSAAMASGDVQIAVSQGIPPFVVAASAGQDIQVIDVAVTYSANDNCVVASHLEIDKSNAGELAGKRVAVPLGTAAHYGFLRQMRHFDIPLDSLQIIDMAPPEGAAALAQRAVDFACGYGGGLARMMQSGNALLTGAEKEELGILVFDVTSAPADFLSENNDIAARFLKVTADANARWNADTENDELLADMAQASGMDLEDARAAISTMKFPDIDAQLSEKWMGGGIQMFMKGVAQVFHDAGSVPNLRVDFDDAVNSAPLKAARRM